MTPPCRLAKSPRRVEVTAETPLLQAETSSLGQVVEERKANELPLNGRNIFNLITVSPSVVAQGGSGGTPVGQNPFSWGNYQIGGSFANQGAEYLDGQPLNIGYINLPIIIPTQDSIGEFKVQYNNLGAEWGKFSGAVSNLSTKSGTNEFHGEAYEYSPQQSVESNEYFHKTSELAGGAGQHAVHRGFRTSTDSTWAAQSLRTKRSFYVSWEQYPAAHGFAVHHDGSAAGVLNGDFSRVCGRGSSTLRPAYAVTESGNTTRPTYDP